jgi:hypothetical protein
MKPPSDNTLLTAVFADALPAEFSTRLLAGTLREVRRQRRQAVARQACLGLAAVLAVFALLPGRMPPVLRQSPSAFAQVPVVHTRAMPDGMVVTSTFMSVDITESRSDSFSNVESAPADRLFEWLDDAAIFALAGNEPVGFVLLDNRRAELVWPGAFESALH